MPDTPDVVRNAEAQRFEVHLEGHLAELDYSRSGDTITFTHTGVPDAMAGRGIGGALARAALEYARTEGLDVVPLCPFVRGYIDKHAEYQPLVKQSSGGWG
jgi:predicted GNAT family acetyltransferase